MLRCPIIMEVANAWQRGCIPTEAQRTYPPVGITTLVLAITSSCQRGRSFLIGLAIVSHIPWGPVWPVSSKDPHEIVWAVTSNDHDQELVVHVRVFEQHQYGRTKKNVGMGTVHFLCRWRRQKPRIYLTWGIPTSIPGRGVPRWPLIVPSILPVACISRRAPV